MVVYVVSDAFAVSNRVRINTFALAVRIPTMHANWGYFETGGLKLPRPIPARGDYVDKILRGSKPGDVPVEQPTKLISS